jgi:hypothetical protein
MWKPMLTDAVTSPIRVDPHALQDRDDRAGPQRTVAPHPTDQVPHNSLGLAVGSGQQAQACLVAHEAIVIRGALSAAR